MRNGLYKVGFRTSLGTGFGVVTLSEGRIAGGDNSSWYEGTYRLENGRLQADIQIDRHTIVPMARSVFGVERARLRLDGETVGDEALLRGTSPDAPAVSFEAVLSRLI